MVSDFMIVNVLLNVGDFDGFLRMVRSAWSREECFVSLSINSI